MYRHSPEDVDVILKAYGPDGKTSQKDVCAIYSRFRFSRGTSPKNETEKSYTNFVSRLSPGSKHREAEISGVKTRFEKLGILYNIIRIMKCDLKTAKKIYQNNIVPVCIGSYMDEGKAVFFETVDNSRSDNYGVISVKHTPHASAEHCLYFITYAEDDLYSEDYRDSDHPWTMKTHYTYRELLEGKLPKSEIDAYIKAQGYKNFQLLNVCVRIVGKASQR